jgi:hypothetical protein
MACDTQMYSQSTVATDNAIFHTESMMIEAPEPPRKEAPLNDKQAQRQELTLMIRNLLKDVGFKGTPKLLT